MKLIFAGGAREVGGSCIYLRSQDKGILFDAGIRQSSTKDPIPDYQSIQEAGGVDAIIISHAHMDHIGTLPIISKAYPLAHIYMTPMSSELTRILLQDSLKIMNRKETEIPHYNENDVIAMMERIVPVPFQTPYSIFDGFEFTFYPAGHIAGAACINLRTPEGDVLYSGDISTFRQRTIEGLRIPKLRPDIAIFESTYGNRLHSNRETEEQRLIDTVKECTEKGMKILIPAFALGRAQEVLLILQSAMKSKKLPLIPVYVDGMVRDINEAYMNHPNELRLPLAKSIMKGHNPFYSDNVVAVDTGTSREELLKKEGSAIFVSSSGMLTGGPSVEYAKTLVQDENACIIITGYQDEEAPGRVLQSMINGDSEQSVNLDGSLYPVKCKVVQVGLSAHSDSSEITAIIEKLACRRIILVHGDDDAMDALGSELSTDFRRQIYEPSCGNVLNFDIHTKRKQITFSFTNTLHLENIQDESDIKMIYSFWKENYNLKSFTVQEIYMIATGKTIHAERLREEEKLALRNLEQLLEQSAYISRDSRRMFLFRINTEEEIQENTKAKEPTMQDVQLVVNKELHGITLRKIGFHQETKTVNLITNYPDAFDKEVLAHVKEVVLEKTGWKVSLSPAINHQAANLLLLKLFNTSLGKISHYDEVHTYNITLNANVDDFQGQITEFEQTTGWKLLVNASDIVNENKVNEIKKVEDNFFYPNNEKKPIEINKAYSMIDTLFSNSKIKPYKKGLVSDQYGKYICLTFYSPELGHRCDDLIQECANNTSYRIGIKKSVNQNLIQIYLMNLCEKYNITVKKSPSFIVNDNCFEIKTDNQNIPESFYDEFNEEIGLIVRVSQ